MEKTYQTLIKNLEQIGQSLWYDNIERKNLENDEIKNLILDGKIKGITSNPSIFQKAIANSADYDVTLKPMAWSGYGAKEIFWQLAIEDITRAASLFEPVYQSSNGKDGFVSLEVDPLLADETDKTIEDALKLWRSVNKTNLMIKIPATKEGIPAIRKAIAAGINVNVTLIFSIDRYAEVIEAYLAGLEDRANQGLSIENIASVASFFVSRMDSKIDGLLKKKETKGEISAEDYKRLAGKAAIANARLAYRLYEEKFNSGRFDALKLKGARVQRPLWASTSTKNPDYRDVIYVEELIAPDTVNTVPPATLDAFLDHGNARITIDKDIDQAVLLFKELEAIGISISNVTDELETEGVAAFSDAYRSLLDSVEARRADAIKEIGELQERLTNQLTSFEKARFAERFFAKDPSLWTTDVEGQEEIKKRMNWISTPFEIRKSFDEVSHLGADYYNKGFTHVVLLGMGGSSLAPEVISKLVGTVAKEEFPGLRLLVLDSTDPEQINYIDEQTADGKAVYIVASKSGTTGEINAFLDYYWEKVKAEDPVNPGEYFIAITDPDTALEKKARERKFGNIFLADPQVGGRNSALTAFGMIPAALMGVDLNLFTQRAATMAEWCQTKLITANPGFVLGAILGVAANEGRDKVTLITDEKWAPFGDWLEQLVAESSGKDGRGMLPIANEPEMSIEKYSDDRIFIRLEQNGERQSLVDELLAMGHPVISIHVKDEYDLAAQFYLWEIAVATACSVIGVNSFDQPDVQDAKIRTLAGLEEYRQQGQFPEVSAFAEYPRIRVLSSIPPTVERRGSIMRLVFSYVEHNLDGAEFVAINAFLPKNEENEALLQNIRGKIGEKFALPVTLGFGPRYLHSTGQFHKGGPNNGLFILITAQRQNDIEIPGQGISFGVFQRAQAIGDLRALEAKGRKVLWLDLAEPDVNILFEQK